MTNLGKYMRCSWHHRTKFSDTFNTKQYFVAVQACIISQVVFNELHPILLLL